MTQSRSTGKDTRKNRVLLSELIQRMQMPERAAQLRLSLIEALRDPDLKLVGFELADTFELTRKDGSTRQVRDFMMEDTPDLQHWFDITERRLGKSGQSRYYRPTRQDVESGRADVELAIDSTRTYLDKLRRTNQAPARKNRRKNKPSSLKALSIAAQDPSTPGGQPITNPPEVIEESAQDHHENHDQPQE